MNTNLLDYLKQHHAFETWYRRNTLDESLFIWKFLLSGNEFPGWEPYRIQALEPPPAPSLSITTTTPASPPLGWLRAFQSVWRPLGSRADALLISDVYECASRPDAHELLLRLLGEFQSPQVALEEQPAMGDVAFRSQSDTVILLARANLVLLLRNAGRDLVLVSDVTAQFDQWLVSKPETTEGQMDPQISRFQASPEEVQIGNTVLLELEASSRTRQPIWYKLFAGSGEIRAGEGNLIYEPTATGPQEITAYAIGENRQARREVSRVLVR